MYEAWNVHRVVRPSRLANAVVERLLLRILDGEFPPGSDLPPEAALATEFAVSRTILREALKGLEEKRVLRIRHGRGTTVRPRADWNLLDPMVLAVQLEYGESAPLGQELSQVKGAMMMLMADLAAPRMTPEAQTELEAAIVRMRAAQHDPLAHREAAQRFAASLAAIADNQVARCVVETINMPFGAGPSASVAESMRQEQELAEATFTRVMSGRVMSGGQTAGLGAGGMASAAPPHQAGAPVNQMNPLGQATNQVAQGAVARIPLAGGHDQPRTAVAHSSL
jgi:DNA-binding FadR family transcriptional regulator